MNFVHFKRSGKIPSEKDKLTMRRSDSENSFLKFLKITSDMLFGGIVLFTLRDFIFFSFSSGFAECLSKDFSFEFFR